MYCRYLGLVSRIMPHYVMILGFLAKQQTSISADQGIYLIFTLMIFPIFIFNTFIRNVA